MAATEKLSCVGLALGSGVEVAMLAGDPTPGVADVAISVVACGRFPLTTVLVAKLAVVATALKLPELKRLGGQVVARLSGGGLGGSVTDTVFQGVARVGQALRHAPAPKPPSARFAVDSKGVATDNLAQKGEIQSIYKAPQAGKGQKQLAEGYYPDDFPATQGSDGKAYFAKEKSIADEYAPHGPYGEGVVEVQVPKDVYDARLRQYEQPYQGGPRIELPIPPKEFDVLNNSPRKLHP